MAAVGLQWVLFVVGHLFLAAVYLSRLPLVWLPLLFGVFFAAVAHVSPAVRRWPARLPYFASVSAATTGMWLLSNEQRTPVAVLAAGLAFLVWFFRSAKIANRVLWHLTIALLMCAGVGFLSGGQGGADWMTLFARKQLGLDLLAAEVAVKLFRKVFHFCFYGTFAFVLATAFRRMDDEPRAAAFAAVTVTATLASFDEGRQHWVVNRSGSPWDVLLDLAGAVTFVVAANVVASCRRARP